MENVPSGDLKILRNGISPYQQWGHRKMDIRSTEASQGEVSKKLLPYRWFLRIGKLPTNEEEANNPEFRPNIRKELFCVLNDIDMLILEQNEVMEQFIEDSRFEEELNQIREQIMKENWGEDE